MRISFPVVLAVMTILFQTMPAYSQRFLFGVNVAGQITNTFTSANMPTALHEDRVLFGPTGEVRLAHGLALEVDALYKRRLDYSNSITVLLGGPLEVTLADLTVDVTTREWQLPLLLKWYLPPQKKLLFIGAGFAARNVAGITHTHGTVSPVPGFPPETVDTKSSQGDIVNPWTYGPVFTAGVALHAHLFHFQPQLRFTHWNGPVFFNSTKLDDLQGLVTVTVGK